MLNILIRTSGRPNGFQRVINSVNSQGLEKVNILVSADDDASEAYAVATEGVGEVVRVPKLVKEEKGHAPYNLYLNSLLNKVENGWVMFQDDDDYYIPGALAKVEKFLKEEGKVYIFKTYFEMFGRDVPGPNNFGKNVVLGDISGTSYAVHHSLAKKYQWGERTGGDYAYLKNVMADPDFKGIEWVDLVIVYVNDAHKGEKFDIPLSDVK